MLVTDVYTTVGSSPEPWTCLDIVLILLKRVVICTFVRKHLLSLLFLYELYPYSLICLFIYQICGLDTFEKQNWFIINLLTSLITPKLILYIFNQIIFILAPGSGLPKIFLPYRNISGVYLQPHRLTFKKCFLASLVKEGLVFIASLFSFRWACGNK